MKPGTKKILIVGGVVGAAALAWWYFNQGPGATSTVTPGSVAQELPTGNMSSTLATPTVITAPSATQMAATGAPSPPIDPTVEGVVEAWGDADGRAPVLRMIQAQVPSEYAGMYDLITNVWQKGLQPSTAQTAFWNALRLKYDSQTNPPGKW